MLHRKPSKQAIAHCSSVQDRRGERTGCFCPDDGTISHSRRTRTEHKLHHGAAQPARLLPKRHPSAAPTHFGRQKTFRAQPTGHRTRQSFLLGPECRTTTWMETPLGQSGTGPRPFERLFLSCPVGPFPCCVSSNLEGLGWAQQGGAGGDVGANACAAALHRYAYGECRLGSSAGPYLGKLLYALSCVVSPPHLPTDGRMCPQGGAHTAPWKDQKLAHPDTQRGQDDA